MSKLKASNELPTYFVPKSVYDAAMDDIKEKVESINKTPTRITSHCHQKRYNYFNTPEPALNHPNLLEATRQAFEDRNFRVLYELIYKGLEKRDFFFSAQLFEYLYAAIEIDPKIENRHEMLVNAVKGFKALNNDEKAEKFIKRAHLLIKNKNSKGTSNSSDEFTETDIKQERTVDVKQELDSD